MISILDSKFMGGPAMLSFSCFTAKAMKCVYVPCHQVLCRRGLCRQVCRRYVSELHAIRLYDVYNQKFWCTTESRTPTGRKRRNAFGAQTAFACED